MTRNTNNLSPYTFGALHITAAVLLALLIGPGLHCYLYPKEYIGYATQITTFAMQIGLMQ